MRFKQLTINREQLTMEKEVIILSEMRKLGILVEVGDGCGI